MVSMAGFVDKRDAGVDEVPRNPEFAESIRSIAGKGLVPFVTGNTVVIDHHVRKPATPESRLCQSLGECRFVVKILSIGLNPKSVVSCSMELVVSAIRKQFLQGRDTVRVFQGYPRDIHMLEQILP